MRLGFFSCQNYPHGFFNAHELMAREDLDFVVNLGDYIYAEAYHSRADGTGVRDDRIGRQRANVIREAISLDDYRDKYKLYRKDPDLRKMHARFPMVSTWDDHEAQDNYAGGAPGGGLPPEQRFTRGAAAARLQGVLRAHAALRAAARPRPPLPHAALRPQRRPDHARRAPVPRRPAVRRRGRRRPAPSTTTRARCSARARRRSSRRALEQSTATWKLVGNEVAIMPVKTGANTYFTYDFWHGYPGERREILEHIKAKGIRDVVFLTGDIHTFAAGDVQIAEGGESVATEIIGGSVTSLALGEGDIPIGGGVILKGNDAKPNTPPGIIDALLGLNPWVDYADFDHHGYVVVEAGRTELKATLRRIDDDQEALDQAPARRLLHDRPRRHVAEGQAPRRLGCAAMNRRPRLELHGSSASPEEAAAVMAAIEQFLRDTAPPPAPAEEPENPWIRAARLEAVERDPSYSSALGSRPASAASPGPARAARRRAGARGRRARSRSGSRWRAARACAASAPVRCAVAARMQPPWVTTMTSSPRSSSTAAATRAWNCCHDSAG